MADITFFETFLKKWASTGSVDGWTETQYKAGWATIGNNPPYVGQFNSVQQLTDEKINWLYSQLKTAADNLGITLTAGDLTSLVDVIAQSMQSASAQATTTQRGTSELATQAETDAGTDNQRVITPKTLAGYSGAPGVMTLAQINAQTTDIGPIICSDNHGILYLWDGTQYAPEENVVSDQTTGVEYRLAVDNGVFVMEEQ